MHISLSLPKDIARRLRRLVEQDGIDPSEFVTEAVSAHLEDIEDGWPIEERFAEARSEGSSDIASTEELIERIDLQAEFDDIAG